MSKDYIRITTLGSCIAWVDTNTSEVFFSTKLPRGSEASFISGLSILMGDDGSFVTEAAMREVSSDGEWQESIDEAVKVFRVQAKEIQAEMEEGSG